MELNPKQSCIVTYSLRYLPYEYKNEIEKIVNDNIVSYCLETEALGLAGNSDIYDVINLNFSDEELYKTETKIENKEIIKAIHLAYIIEHTNELVFNHQAYNAMNYCNENNYTGYFIDLSKVRK